MENCKKYINVNNGTININLDQDISWSLVVYGNFGLSQYYGKGSATVQTICLEPTAYGYVTFATSDDECANAKCIVSVSDVNGYESFNVSTTYTQFNCKDSIARVISNRNIIIKDSFEDFSVSGNGSTILTLTSKNNDTFKHVVKVYNADNENEFVIVVVEQKSCRDTSSDSCLLDIVNINQSFSGDKNYNVTNWTNGSLSFQLSTNANDITYPNLSSNDYKISRSGNLYTITPLPKNSDEKYSQQTLTFTSKECGSTSISFQYDNSSQGGNGNYFYIEYINGEKQEGTNTKTASLSRDKDNVSIKSKLNYAISNNSSNNCTIKRNGNTFTFIVKDVSKDANGTLALKQDTTNDTITVTFTYDSSSSGGGGWNSGCFLEGVSIPSELPTGPNSSVLYQLRCGYNGKCVPPKFVFSKYANKFDVYTKLLREKDCLYQCVVSLHEPIYEDEVTMTIINGYCMGADSITLKKSYHDKSPAPPMEKMELISFTVDKIGDFGACGETITKDLTFTAVYTKGTEIFKYVNHEIPNYNQITCIEGDTSVLNLSEPSITLGKQESEIATPYYYKFQYVSAVNNAHKMTADLSFKHYGKDGELSEELISTDYSNICLSVNYNSVDYDNCNGDDTIVVDSDQVESLRLSAYMTATNKYVVNGDCGSSSEREETVEITNGFIFEIVGETNGLSISNNILTVPLNKSGKETKTTIVAKYPNAYNISKETYIIVPPIIEDAIQIVATCDLTKALDGTSWFIKTERCMDGVKIEKIVRESATSSYVKFAFDSTKIKSWKLFSGFTQVVETNKVRQLAGSSTFRGRSEGATYIHSGISGQTVRFKCFCFQNRNNDSWAGKDANVLRVQMLVLGKIEYK